MAVTRDKLARTESWISLTLRAAPALVLPAKVTDTAAACKDAPWVACTDSPVCVLITGVLAWPLTRASMSMREMFTAAAPAPANRPPLAPLPATATATIGAPASAGKSATTEPWAMRVDKRSKAPAWPLLAPSVIATGVASMASSWLAARRSTARPLASASRIT